MPNCDRNRRITLAMKNQGRHPDRRQHVADVALVIGCLQRENRSRTRRGAFEPAKPLDQGFILDHARRIDTDQAKTVARFEPAASSTARTSPIRSSRVCSVTRSESPWPRLSKTITRAKEVSLCRMYWFAGSS